MKQQELLRRLEEEGVVAEAYDFNGTQDDEVYCLERHPSGWTYYYRERGICREERVFASWNEAARHFLGQVLEDPTTRMRR